VGFWVYRGQNAGKISDRLTVMELVKILGVLAWFVGFGLMFVNLTLGLLVLAAGLGATVWSISDRARRDRQAHEALTRR